MPKMVLESPFPPEECQRRLAAATEPDTIGSNVRFGEGVLVQLYEGGFRLRLRRALVRNSFSRLLYGHYQATSKGSAIEVWPRLHPFVFVFMILWFGGIALWTGIVLALMIAERVSGQRILVSSSWPGILMAPALGLGGFFLVRTGREDGDELVEFLERSLEARPRDQRAA